MPRGKNKRHNNIPKNVNSCSRTPILHAGQPPTRKIVSGCTGVG